MTTTDDFIDSFKTFNVEQVDRNVGAWIRQFADGTITEWQNAENVLMRILLDLALLEPGSLELPSGTKFEVLASALARALGNCDREAEYSTDYLVTLSALSYAITGNFPSAAVYAKKARENKGTSDLENWMMRILSSKYFVLKNSSPPSEFITYAIFMDEALLSGQKEDYRKAEQELEDAIQKSIDNFTGKEKFLLLLWKLINKRFEQLSTSRVLRETGFQNQAFINALIEETLMLYPSQVHTIKNYPLTIPSDPIFISLPTSTGKSLLGEIALVSSLSWDTSKWLGVYLAPYRALTDQLQSRMQKRLRKIDITCVIRRGGYLSEDMNIDEGKPTILIATPEAFDALLRVKPQIYKNISACVFDEFHLIEQQQRGLRYEGILGRFLGGAAGKKPPKIIALSAVVQDTNTITKWLQTSQLNVSNLPWIPTSRKLAIVNPDGKVRFYSPGEHFDDTKDDKTIWEGKIDLPNYVKYYPKFPIGRQRIIENIAAVAIDQWNRFKQPILVLSSSRQQTRQIARLISNAFNEESGKPLRLSNEISLKFPFLYTLQECLKRKVAYHNAALPDWVKNQIEKLIQEKELRIVVATTTLAEGVDLPFRAVVLAGWKQWLFGKYRAMPSLLFRNIAGRCGRAWEFTEGDTLIIDSPDKEITEFEERDKLYLNKYIKPSKYGLNSSISREIEATTTISSDTQSVLESQYIAYIAACEKAENTEEKFSLSLYASNDNKDKLITTINQFTEEMLNEPNYAILERNSPLQLTEFGNTALKTGLSPKSTISLARFLTNYDEIIEPTKGKKTRKSYGIGWNPIIASIWEYHLNIQELRNSQINSRGFPVKDKNILLTIMAWVSGTPIEIIALFLYGSKEKKTILEWLNGEAEGFPSNFEDDIDQIAIFCKNYLSENWAWVIRGASAIAESMTETKIQAETLNELGLKLQYGVRHLASAKYLQSGKCPIDRSKLDWLITSFQPTNLSVSSVVSSEFSDWLKQNEEEILKMYFFSNFPKLGVTPTDIKEFIDFLSINNEEKE